MRHTTIQNGKRQIVSTLTQEVVIKGLQGVRGLGAWHLKLSSKIFPLTSVCVIHFIFYGPISLFLNCRWLKLPSLMTKLLRESNKVRCFTKLKGHIFYLLTEFGKNNANFIFLYSTLCFSFLLWLCYFIWTLQKPSSYFVIYAPSFYR